MKRYILLTILVLFVVGIMNGATSRSHSCFHAYLDLTKPIHYIGFPHTAGYYLGRALTKSYSEDRFISKCDNTFNPILKGFGYD